MLHSYSPGQVGRRQIAILKEEGVPLNRVKMDHSNDTTDLEYLYWMLEEGCYLGMDRYPGEGVSPLARTKTLKALVDAGFVAQPKSVGISRGLVLSRADTDIDLHSLPGTDPFEFPFLQYTQELGLEARRDFGNLVQQERPLMGQLYAAFLLVIRPGKGSFLVTEHLALHQGLRNAGEIDIDKRTLAIGTHGMDVPGQ